MDTRIRPSLSLALLLAVLVVCGCGTPPRQVVIYTSVDQSYAEQVLRDFETRSGIRVLAVYDVEATKTVGLAQRLLAERERPQADVFWNGEFLRTIYLKEQGVLARADFTGAGLPPDYLDPAGYWAAFGGRGRVILINTARVAPAAAPTSLFDLGADRYLPTDVGLASPLFGTAATEAAAVHALLGADAAHTFYAQVAQRGVQVLDGNSVVRDRVVDGQLAWGITDTDDACGAIMRGAPVDVVFPDQAPDQIGTLIIPNTLALVAGSPHPREAQQLANYLLSAETEARLVGIGWVHFPARPLPAGVAPACFADVKVRRMDVAFEAIYQQLNGTQRSLEALFIR